MGDTSGSVEIKASVLQAVNEVVTQFRTAPYAFLYESDLQCALFAALRSRISQQIEIPRKHSETTDAYRLTPVYSEYGVYGSKSKIDIVCVDPVRARTAPRETYGSQNVYIYCLPVLVAIEIKYSVMGGKCYLPTACEDDRAKLARLKALPEPHRPVHGLVLGFLQDVSDDLSGSSRWLRALPRVDTVTKLDGVFCATSEALYEAPHGCGWDV